MSKKIIKRKVAQTLAGIIIITIATVCFYSSKNQIPPSPRTYAIFPMESIIPDEVVEWMIMSSSTRVFVLEEEILKMLQTTKELNKTASQQIENSRQLSVVNVGIFESDRKKHIKNLIALTRKAGWRNLQLEKRNPKHYVFEKNNIFIRLSVIEQRLDYWFISESKDDFARAFLGLTIRSVEWPVTKNYFVNKSLLVPWPVDSYLWQLPKSKFLQCNETLAPRLRQMYPKYYTNEPTIPDDFVQELAYVRDLLLAHRATPMITAGTALGWYRECGFVPFTSDTDLAFLASEWSQSLEDAVKNDTRLKLFWILGKPSDSMEITVYVRNIRIDIFALYQEANFSWVSGMLVEQKAKLMYVYPPLEQICTCELYKRLFYVRCDVIVEIESNYGSKWYEPSDESTYLWYSSPPNVRQIGNWNDSEWNSVYRRFP